VTMPISLAATPRNWSRSRRMSFLPLALKLSWPSRRSPAASRSFSSMLPILSGGHRP
jgi:hypothetical protein